MPGMAAGAEARAPRAAAVWPLALALLALALFQLGAAPLFDVDEGAFSEATREMLASGDWLHTTLNGEDRFDKPIGDLSIASTMLRIPVGDDDNACAHCRNPRFAV